MCKWCQRGLANVRAWLWELFRVSFWRQISDDDSCFLVVHYQLQWLHLLPFDVYEKDPFRLNFSTQTVQITQNVWEVFWPGVVTPDMERSSPLSILGVTQTLAQLSVHIFCLSLISQLLGVTQWMSLPVQLSLYFVRGCYWAPPYGRRQITALLSTTTC